MAFQYPKKKKLALTWDEFELIRYLVAEKDASAWDEREKRKLSDLETKLREQTLRFSELRPEGSDAML